LKSGQSIIGSRPVSGVGWLDYFRKWASKYDREVEAYDYDPEKLLKPFVPLIRKRKRGLDVGCGTGKSLEALKTVCDEVVGVEPVEKMALQAEAKGFRVFRMKGEELGRLVEDGVPGRFDLVAFFASIDYMNVELVVAGVEKVLEPGPAGHMPKKEAGLVFLTVEPENEEKVVRAFGERGFRVVKRDTRKAYEGQTYVCLLMNKG